MSCDVADNCCVCGKKVYCCDKEQSVNNNYVCDVHRDGCEVKDGVWVCSEQCEANYRELKRR